MWKQIQYVQQNLPLHLRLPDMSRPLFVDLLIDCVLRQVPIDVHVLCLAISPQPPYSLRLTGIVNFLRWCKKWG